MQYSNSNGLFNPYQQFPSNSHFPFSCSNTNDSKNNPVDCYVRNETPNTRLSMNRVPFFTQPPPVYSSNNNSNNCASFMRPSLNRSPNINPANSVDSFHQPFPSFPPPNSFLSQPFINYVSNCVPVNSPRFPLRGSNISPFPHCPPPVPFLNSLTNSTVSSPQLSELNENNQFKYPPPPLPVFPHSHAVNVGRRFSYNHRTSNNQNKQFTTQSHSFTKKLAFHCGSCDRDFPTEDKYSQHISEHVTCGKEGCTFSAHAKIVEKHIIMQHRTGLFNRIVRGYSPEEINKWISDRKKQYPTQERIDEKQSRKEEMEKRGERYKEPKNSFVNNRNSNYRERKNRYNNFGNRTQPFRAKSFGNNRSNSENNDSTAECQRPKRPKKEVIIISDDDEEDFMKRNLPPFRGIGYYTNDQQINKVECEVLPNVENVIQLEVDRERSPIPVDESESKKTYLHPNKSSDENDIDSDVLIIDSDSIIYNSDNKSPSCIQNALLNSLDLIKGYESENDIITDCESEISCHATIENNETVNTDSDTDSVESLMATRNLLGLETNIRNEKNDIIDSDSEPEECSSKCTVSENDVSNSTNEADNIKKCIKHEGIKVKKPRKRKRRKINKCVAVEKLGGVENNEEVIKDTITIQKDENFRVSFSSEKVIIDDNRPSQNISINSSNIGNSSNSIVQLPCNLPGSECSLNLPNDSRNSEPEECLSIREINTVVDQNTDENSKTEKFTVFEGTKSKKNARKRKRHENGNSEDESIVEKTAEELDKKQKSLRPPVFQHYKRYRPPTLLEKLLATEIKHERNVILQCVRYVVQNNYFNIGQDKLK